MFKKLMIFICFGLLAKPIFAFEFIAELLVDGTYCQDLLDEISWTRKHEKKRFFAEVYPYLGQVYNAIEESKIPGDVALAKQEKLQAFILIQAFLGIDHYHTMVEKPQRMPAADDILRDPSLPKDIEDLRVAMFYLASRGYLALKPEIMLYAKCFQIWLNLSQCQTWVAEMAREFVSQYYNGLLDYGGTIAKDPKAETWGAVNDLTIKLVDFQLKEQLAASDMKVLCDDLKNIADENDSEVSEEG